MRRLARGMSHEKRALRLARELLPFMGLLSLDIRFIRVCENKRTQERRRSFPFPFRQVLCSRLT